MDVDAARRSLQTSVDRSRARLQEINQQVVELTHEREGLKVVIRECEEALRHLVDDPDDSAQEPDEESEDDPPLDLTATEKATEPRAEPKPTPAPRPRTQGHPVEGRTPAEKAARLRAAVDELRKPPSKVPKGQRDLPPPEARVEEVNVFTCRHGCGSVYDNRFSRGQHERNCG